MRNTEAQQPTIVIDRHALRRHYRPADYRPLDWREDPNHATSTLCGVDYHGTGTVAEDRAHRQRAGLYPVSYEDVALCAGCAEAWAEGVR